jgi:predicted small lipoprotein YifL
MRLAPFLLITVILVTVTSGCGMKRPFERPPGNVDAQRQEAARHDPYVDNDAGPEVVGGRPRDFNKPWAEPKRNRVNQEPQFNPPMPQ